MKADYPEYLKDHIYNLADKASWYAKVFNQNQIEVEAEIIKFFKEEYEKKFDR